MSREVTFYAFTEEDLRQAHRTGILHPPLRFEILSADTKDGLEEELFAADDMPKQYPLPKGIKLAHVDEDGETEILDNETEYGPLTYMLGSSLKRFVDPRQYSEFQPDIEVVNALRRLGKAYLVICLWL